MKVQIKHGMHYNKTIDMQCHSCGHGYIMYVYEFIREYKNGSSVVNQKGIGICACGMKHKRTLTKTTLHDHYDYSKC